MRLQITPEMTSNMILSPSSPTSHGAYKASFPSQASLTPKIAELYAAKLYHLRTLWLFTRNDVKTIVVPSTVFAVTNSIPILRAQESMTMVSVLAQVFTQMSTVLLWLWIHLLCFTVNNQRLPLAVVEDKLNKPWRPIPAGRLSADQARILGIVGYPVSFVTSLVLGGTIPSMILLCLFFLHNECGGDSHWIPRNLLNAGGFVGFAAGALEIALLSSIPKDTIVWFVIIAAVIGTTIHSQDMYDQEGDAAIGRSTIPLVFGDAPARWSISIAVLFWTVVCPLYWQCGVIGFGLTALLGVWVACRQLIKRDVASDRKTFKLHNVWLAIMYLLPLLT